MTMNRIDFATYHVRLEARLVFPFQELAPVNAVEEVVCLDLRSALCSETLLRVAVQETGEQVSCRRWHNFRARKVQRFCEDFAIHVVCVLVVERRQTRQHLVQENTKGPPIDSLGVACSRKQLWSKVFWGSTEC